MRKTVGMLVVSLLLLSVFVVPWTFAEGAKIWTDKTDYGPEDTVTIFGSGFSAGATVTISIVAPDSSVHTIYAVTDGSGAFTAQYVLDGTFGVYAVTATDGTNTATTTFMDAKLLRIWADTGSYVDSDPDAWILQSWVVSSAFSPGGSLSFELYIDTINSCKGQATASNVYLAIAVNDTNQIASITVGSTTVTTFTYGNVTWPTEAGGGKLPPHGVYPTYYALVLFGDINSNYAYYTTPGNPYGPYWAYRAYTTVTITAKSTMSAEFKVHFDAQGVFASGSQQGAPDGSPFSHDLTVAGSVYVLPHYTRYSWPMFHHDLTHTGYTESPAPNTNQTQWNYTTGGAVSSSPAVVDGKVYFGSWDGKVYCLDASTGVHIWNYTTGDDVLSSPAVADGKVYIGSNDGNVYCLDASAGVKLWNYTTGDDVGYSSPAVVDGRVYVGSSDNNVYCLNASTGAKLWNRTIDNPSSSPAVVGGMVYVGSYDGNVYCLDAATGAKLWNRTIGVAFSSPAIVNTKVYIGSFDNNVYCLNAVTGAKIWNYTTGMPVGSSPAVGDDMVYVGSYDGNVYCLNAVTGAKIWNYTTGAPVKVSSPAVADGKVYIGSNDNKVYCLDASNGALIWSYVTGNIVWSSPAVADGMVYVGSQDGLVYAFGNVVRSEDYPTIQAAINAAPSEATVIIAPGIYHESIVINKTLTIIGLPGSAPVFAGGGSGIAVTLLPSASGSIIAGVVITHWDQGILIIDATDCKIYDNIMSLMNYNGITLEGTNAANNLIYSNIFQDNTVAVNLTASSTSNTIYKNIISLNNIGFNLESGGNVIYANTISENQIGIDMSNSNGNIIYHNNFINNKENAKSEQYSNAWDNGYPTGGNYWSDYTGVDDKSGSNQDVVGSDSIGDTNYTIAVNNIDRYPLMQPFNPHDIGITNVITSKTIVGQGFTLRIDLKILNYGMYTETFTVTAYANTTIIATQTITLANRNSTTITFTWNTTGFAKGNYTISAYAWPVPDETDTTDNTFPDGTILVTIPGDINGDFKVDIKDLVLVIKYFGSYPGHPTKPWNPNADVNSDFKDDIKDLVLVIKHFGEHDP